MLKHKIGLIVATLLVTSLAIADSFKVDWSIKTDQPITLNDYGFKYSEDGINCTVGSLERMIPSGEKRHITCFAGKEKIVDRDVRCDKQQIENFMDIGILYVECKTR